MLGAVLSLGRKVLAEEREDLLKPPDLMRVLVVAPPLWGELQSPNESTRPLPGSTIDFLRSSEDLIPECTVL